MIQNEMVFKTKGHKYYERVFNTKTKEVNIRPYTPVYEVFTKSPQNAETPFRFVLDQDQFLQQHIFSSQKELTDFCKTKETLNQQIFGKSDNVYSHIRNNYFREQEQFTSRIWYIDIEAVPPPGEGFPDPGEAKWPVNAIQIYDNYTSSKIILVIDQLNNPSAFAEKHPEVKLKVCGTEEKLFEVFFKLLEQMKPTILTAWNGNFFDFPYLTNRAMKLKGVNHRRLSPVNSVSEKDSWDDAKIPIWEGLYLIDMMDAYKEFTYTTQTSYSLDNIAKVELGEGSGKVDYGEFDNIAEFFLGDYDKFISYAVKDIEILFDLDMKMNLMELMRTLAHMMGINYDDAFGTVKPWGMYLTNLGYYRNLIMPKSTKHELNQGVVGGFVADPQKGMHAWEASIDVNSMYPLLGMKAHNMSAETYIPEEQLHPELMELRNKYQRDEDETKFLNDDVMNEIEPICKKHNVSFGINAFFKNDKLGIIPEVIDNIYRERKIAKQKMLKYKTMGSRVKQRVKDGIEKISAGESPFNFITFDIIEDNSISFDELYAVELGYLSPQECERVINHCEKKQAYWDANQMALKISMNSLYGALSNKYFVLFNRDIAASITGNGRAYIRGMSIHVNKKLNSLLKRDESNFEDFCTYNDTDSVVGDTVIETENFGKIAIEDYFDKAKGEIIYRPEKGDFIKKVAPCNQIEMKKDAEWGIYENDRTDSLSMGLGRVRKNRVMHIMKHQVKKKMYKIRVKGKFVTVTEDHSVIIRRDGKQLDVKPADMKKGDECIIIK